MTLLALLALMTLLALLALLALRERKTRASPPAIGGSLNDVIKLRIAGWLKIRQGNLHPAGGVTIIISSHQPRRTRRIMHDKRKKPIEPEVQRGPRSLPPKISLPPVIAQPPPVPTRGSNAASLGSSAASLVAGVQGIALCPSCNRQMAAPPELAGQLAACPHCGQQIVMPGAPLAAVPQAFAINPAVANFAVNPAANTTTNVVIVDRRSDDRWRHHPAFWLDPFAGHWSYWLFSAVALIVAAVAVFVFMIESDRMFERAMEEAQEIQREGAGSRP